MQASPSPTKRLKFFSSTSSFLMFNPINKKAHQPKSMRRKTQTPIAAKQF